MDTKKVMGLGVIALMLLSTLALVLVDYAQTGSSTLKYNGVKFTFANNQYTAKINGQQHSFLFFPGNLEFINVTDGVKSLLQSPVLTVTYNPNSTFADSLGSAQYYFEEQLSDVKTIERAVTNNEGVGLPKKSCEDATQSQPVIELSQGNQSIIEADGNCIRIQAFSERDLFEETERVIYALLGVMS